ncbi:MAG: prolipoprotein diacylglyceryl transferase [Eubacteriales bacterium]|nr:prolipoprotein diacylglyceryl transferase [Eubacteriales bacterium]
MKNELLHIGSFTVYGYGLMIAIGIVFCYYTLEFRAYKKKLDQEKVFGLFVTCAIGGFAFAKIMFWITEWKNFLRNPMVYLGNPADGFVVFGGIIGGILCGLVYCKIRKMEFLDYFDLAMPSIALAQGFGRLGCFLAGCCYGKTTDSLLAVTFHESEFAPNGVPLIPTQIYSSLLDFCHFFLLVYLAKKVKKSGQVAACYLIFYSLGRFVLEFFRGDLERGSVGALSTSQFIGIFTFGAGVLLYLGIAKFGRDVKEKEREKV